MRAGTFQHTWNRAVEQHADRVFLVFRSEVGTRSEWTYREFDALVATTAGRLREAGVCPGSAVHLVLRNCPAFVALWLASARLGAWFVPTDPASAARDIANQVSRTQPTVGVCATARVAAYREGANGAVPVVLELDEDAADVDVAGPLHGLPVTTPHPVAARDRLAVMFTSGTTSEPKGVVLTQANYATVADAMAAAAGVQPRHRWYVTLPLFHANAQYYCFAAAIAAGASVALSATFSASGWVRHARELEVTHASLFAAPIRMILARCPAGEEPLALEHVWFAQSVGSEHYDQFSRLVGTRPRQLYGMTETVAIVSAEAAESPRSDRIGRPIPGRRIAIHDVAGDGLAAPGSHGELAVFGRPGIDLFAGYLHDEQTTSLVLRETGGGTWFSTGDLVQADEDGALTFVGRIDDVIKVSGENVSLTQVEAAVAQAPGVLEVAIIAQADPVRDVVPVAYVVPRDPANPPTPTDLDRWAGHNLSPAARPRAWHFIAELPRTSVGKVRRFRIPR